MRAGAGAGTEKRRRGWGSVRRDMRGQRPQAFCWKPRSFLKTTVLIVILIVTQRIFLDESDPNPLLRKHPFGGMSELTSKAGGVLVVILWPSSHPIPLDQWLLGQRFYISVKIDTCTWYTSRVDSQWRSKTKNEKILLVENLNHPIIDQGPAMVDWRPMSKPRDGPLMTDPVMAHGWTNPLGPNHPTGGLPPLWAVFLTQQRVWDLISQSDIPSTRPAGPLLSGRGYSHQE